jgi:hypothetical protein
MSIVMRNAFSNSRFSLRMGCGEQLLLSDSLASAEIQHRDPERCRAASPDKAKARRGHGE